MRYVVDHDLHMHSYLSLCANHGHQVPVVMLRYAKENGLSTICLTDHYWDERVPGAEFLGPYRSGAAIWYSIQNTRRTDLALPLPQDEKVRFLYGCETEMDMHCRIGISPEELKRRDFIIIPTTHLHMAGFTVAREDSSVQRRAELWVSRFAALLDMDLPFHKIGVAHLTCTLFSPERTPQSSRDCLSLVSDATMTDLFGKAAKRGIGVELNFNPDQYEKAGVLDDLLRPYRIAIDCGCKFYFGSDAHAPDEFTGAKAKFEKIVDLLGLTEDQKFKV